MKVIFLDFDGVLITRERLKATWPHTPDPECVKRLNRITDETGACIVVSSLWRTGRTTDELREILAKWGVTGKVLGRTPIRNFTDIRGHEIQIWLDIWNDTEFDTVTNFVILDDDSDMAHLLGFLVKTNIANGLTEEDANDAIQRLTSKVLTL